jgi:hypothetical protein
MDRRPDNKRNRLIAELQERVQTLQRDIARLETQITVAIDEKRLHEEDLQFHLELLEELGGFTSEEEEDEESSIEVIPAASGREHVGTRITGAAEAEAKRTTSKAEIQEARDKARAWHLDRKKEKEQKKK